MKRTSFTLIEIVMIALIAICLSFISTTQARAAGVTKRSANVIAFNTNLSTAGSTITSNVNSSTAANRGAGAKTITGIQITGQTASKNYYLQRNIASPDNYTLFRFTAPATLNGNPIMPADIEIPVEGLIYKTDETTSGTADLLIYFK